MSDNFASFGRGVNLGSLTSDPSNPKAGDFYYNSSSNVFRFYDGSTWADIGGGGGGADTALSNLASVAINSSLIFGTAVTGVFKTKDAAGATTGLTVQTGDDSAAGGSGLVILQSGNSTSGGSGGVILRSGTSNGSTSGNLILQSGAPSGANTNSGSPNLKSGNVTGTGISGQVDVLSGTSVNGASGLINVNSGQVSGSATSGVVTVFSGNNVGTGATGTLALKSGNIINGGNSANTGDVNISSGTTTGSGTRGTINLDSTKVTSTGPVVLPNYTVAGLPSASTSGQGALAFVTDSNQTIIAGLGTTVAGGGTDKVPVYSDGTNWIIG